MIAVFTGEGLMRVDGYRSSRSGNEREGDHDKSEDFSHACLLVDSRSVPPPGPRTYDHAANICVRRTQRNRLALRRAAYCPRLEQSGLSDFCFWPIGVALHMSAFGPKRTLMGSRRHSVRILPADVHRLASARVAGLQRGGSQGALLAELILGNLCREPQTTIDEELMQQWRNGLNTMLGKGAYFQHAWWRHHSAPQVIASERTPFWRMLLRVIISYGQKLYGGR
jgi:hypothetical protein